MFDAGFKTFFPNQHHQEENSEIIIYDKIDSINFHKRTKSDLPTLIQQ